MVWYKLEYYMQCLQLIRCGQISKLCYVKKQRFRTMHNTPYSLILLEQSVRNIYWYQYNIVYVFSNYGKTDKKPFIKFSFQKEKWVVSPVEKWVEMSSKGKRQKENFSLYILEHIFVLCTCIQKNEWLKLETYILHDRFLQLLQKLP